MSIKIENENTDYHDFGKVEVHHNKCCLECGKPLRRFRNKNYGKKTNRKDFFNRTRHLKCYKIYKDRLFWKWRMEEYQKTGKW
tara:strand:+ start:686 stop:934 length:249 start_codon:yes stop_codon:yes gene_type:complete